MRLTEFHQLVNEEFGSAHGAWLVDSHVIEKFGKTARQLLVEGTEVREIWWGLCHDFRIPEERWLGQDL
ncbi:DUF3046 domain-containing protein [Corynebacterium sp. ES2794-CONJ1]|uniref:DUF3046 domain-containing protein n=1 Tax=Corynebacterium sp. ES2794-CONJ1 TaxID=2980553 RepID=UPI0021DA4B8C|nr:DUF3046 domain-containing protein [Corynebacterium sp. ES2794-CONJ1]MCU9518519.1 DUF3046 domain-containing protein [Corynebacterium sp. ES2794-CONJ1]